MRMAAAYVARRRRLPWLYETVRQIGRRSPCPSGRPPGAPRLRREREYQYRNPPAPSHDFRILTRAELQSAAAGGRSVFVILEGGSCAGKTRALFEGLL